MSKANLRKSYHSISKTIDQSTLSYQSTNDYKQILRHSLQQLHALGYNLASLEQFKRKHIHALVNQWKSESLSVGTMKNRLSAIRRSAEILKKYQLVEKNEAYDIGKRTYVVQESKAITDIDFSRVKDPYLKTSFELQKHFGLRREEALKIKPHQADRNVVIELQASWTKGGIQRMVPITNAAQRECLDRAKALVSSKESLIPKAKSYKQQRTAYDNTVRLCGYANLHGLRHAYAQRRYEEITHRLTKGHGWKPPLAGGPSKKSLNGYEKNIDLQTRKIISEELGHSRPEILKSYCG